VLTQQVILNGCVQPQTFSLRKVKKAFINQDRIGLEIIIFFIFLGNENFFLILVKGNFFWKVIAHGLVDRENYFRKRSLYLLKRSTDKMASGAFDKFDSGDLIA